MRKFWKYGWSALLTGVLVILPVYLTALLLLKAMKTVTGLVRPLARWLPDWFPAQHVLSFLFVVILCFLVGIAVRTSIGQVARNRIESSVLQKIPGYTLFRSMTRQLAGDSGETAWSWMTDPSRFSFLRRPRRWRAWSIILAAHRVHSLDVPFTQVLKAVSRWGLGSKDLVAAMEIRGTPSISTR